MKSVKSPPGKEKIDTNKSGANATHNNVVTPPVTDHCPGSSCIHPWSKKIPYLMDTGTNLNRITNVVI